MRMGTISVQESGRTAAASLPRHYEDVNGQLHEAAALSLSKEPVPIQPETGWATEQG
jgi:hypothetical protein